MKKKTIKSNRLGLTILFAGIIFTVIFFLISLVGIVTGLLIRNGVITIAYGQNRGIEYVIFNMSLVSLVLGLIFSVLVGNISLRPVNNVINAMNRLAAGDFRTRLKFGNSLGKHPAAKEVTQSFNHMAEELEKTELLRADFVDNFSHEFKTPIVSIAGFADLMIEGNVPEDEQKEYLKIISEESHRLADMATRVLLLTKVENQEILTDRTEFNLSEQIRNCILMFENKWTEKDLNMDIDFGDYYISGNREMLQQVWINLIDNAIKYADEKGTVKIRMTDTEKELMVSISDTGKEIPEESIGNIFRKFYQADRSHSSSGNGIGLSIVRAITELHGGEVMVSSNSSVTTFTVVFHKNRLK